MPAPVTNDLRWRIIWLVWGARKTIHETGELLGIMKKTVGNILRHFGRFGNLRPSRIGRPNVMSVMTTDEAFALMEYTFLHPGAYLWEAVSYIEDVTGGQFNALSLRRCLKWHNFPRKKVCKAKLGLKLVTGIEFIMLCINFSGSTLVQEICLWISHSTCSPIYDRHGHLFFGQHGLS